MNTYIYTNNNPHNGVDPFGLMTIAPSLPLDFPGIMPRPIPFPLDPIFVPFDLPKDKDDGLPQPRACKKIKTVSSKPNDEGRFDLVCTFRCTGGDVITIKINSKKPECPDYYLDVPNASLKKSSSCG